MRAYVAGLVFCVLLAPGRVTADDRPAPPPKPETPEQAVEKALAAVAAKDDAALKALAGRDDPDPWIVADELCALARFDAAEAFAKAAPRADVERLPEYVAAQRAKPTDPAVREGQAGVVAAFAAGRPADALAAIDAVPRDGRDVVAVRLEFGRGRALRAADRVEESVSSLNAAGEAALALGWLSRAAQAYRESGTGAYSRSDFRAAQDACEALLRIEERRGSRRGVAAAVGNLGTVLTRLGSYAKALACHERALALKEELGDRAGVAATLGNIGTTHAALGSPEKARPFHERALKLREELGDRAGVAATLGEIGCVEEHLGRYAKALEYQERALELYRAAGDRHGVAIALGNIGVVRTAVGDYAKAMDCLERALATMRETGDRMGAARALGGIGLVHRKLGAYAKALAFHERSMALLEEVGDRAGVAAALGSIGTVHDHLGSYEQALEFQERSLRIREEIGDRAGIAGTLLNIGGAHENRGSFAEALECQERALKLLQETGDRAGAAACLGSIGNVQAKLGSFPQALDSLGRAQAIQEELRDRAGAASTLLNVARIRERQGEWAKARDCAERALAEAKSLGALDLVVRAHWATAAAQRGAGDHGAAVRAARDAVELMPGVVRGVGDDRAAPARDVYAGVFDVGASSAAATGDAASALFFAEGGRAGALVEALRTRDALAGTGLPAALADAERTARARQAEAAKALRRAVATGDVAATKEARTALESAQRELLETVGRIQREAKAAADVGYPAADPLDAIRARLREGEALVLVRLVDAGVGDAIAVVVTPGGARIAALGPTRNLEAACTALAADGRDTDPAPAVAALRKLVIEPLALDAKTTRVLVSPDGALSYVPFALLAPEKEIVCVPSGTTYGVLLEEAPKRGQGVLALGDPDYGVKSDPMAEAVALRGATSLVRLPATGTEARAVGDVVLVGRDATESGLRDALAKKPRWRAVHLACHGLVDPDRPMLSSLALTPSAEDDGFLSALDVFRMKVPADLAVLSACETGRGKVYRAEGIVGLTRAFMFAGAPRVLVSLWKVDDEATRALMTKFYELWNPKDGKGVPAATALRQAQEFVRSQEKSKHPRYWAAWVLWGLPE